MMSKNVQNENDRKQLKTIINQEIIYQTCVSCNIYTVMITVYKLCRKIIFIKYRWDVNTLYEYFIWTMFIVLYNVHHTCMSQDLINK